MPHSCLSFDAVRKMDRRIVLIMRPSCNSYFQAPGIVPSIETRDYIVKINGFFWFRFDVHGEITFISIRGKNILRNIICSRSRALGLGQVRERGNSERESKFSNEQKIDYIMIHLTPPPTPKIVRFAMKLFPHLVILCCVNIERESSHTHSNGVRASQFDSIIGQFVDPIRDYQVKF